MTALDYFERTIENINDRQSLEIATEQLEDALITVYQDNQQAIQIRKQICRYLISLNIVICPEHNKLSFRRVYLSHFEKSDSFRKKRNKAMRSILNCNKN